MFDNQSNIIERSQNNTFDDVKFPVEVILKNKSEISIYAKDDFIFRADQPSDQIFIVESGRVKISSPSDNGKEILKSILGEGELFGEMALTGEKTRKDFAMAMDSRTVVRALSASEIRQMMSQNPEIGETIFQVLGKRIRRTERRLFSVILKDARTRIVDFLKELAEEKGQKVGFETMIKNHFTHKDIANLTGTSRQTVTTTLNALRDKNIINFDRRRILIRDLDLLV